MLFNCLIHHLLTYSSCNNCNCHILLSSCCN
uniref:Uncharacterized protein n=1 Tax=Arundo donax TaxID=35708 RepID=A0A0A9BWY3_ARUDO